MELHAVIHEEDGSYWAEVKELPGCFASGRDLEEIKEALIEAIGLCLPEAELVEGQPKGRGKKRRPSVRVDELKLITA